jgi:hypothetical protein
MSGELDVASGCADFRLIDPPRVSPKPVSPNRLRCCRWRWLAALGGGLFVAFVASQLRPVFTTRIRPARTRPACRCWAWCRWSERCRSARERMVCCVHTLASAAWSACSCAGLLAMALTGTTGG